MNIYYRERKGQEVKWKSDEDRYFSLYIIRFMVEIPITKDRLL